MIESFRSAAPPLMLCLLLLWLRNQQATLSQTNHSFVNVSVMIAISPHLRHKQGREEELAFLRQCGGISWLNVPPVLSCSTIITLPPTPRFTSRSHNSPLPSARLATPISFSSHCSNSLLHVYKFPTSPSHIHCKNSLYSILPQASHSSVHLEVLPSLSAFIFLPLPFLPSRFQTTLLPWPLKSSSLPATSQYLHTHSCETIRILCWNEALR